MEIPVQALPLQVAVEALPLERIVEVFNWKSVDLVLQAVLVLVFRVQVRVLQAPPRPSRPAPRPPRRGGAGSWLSGTANVVQH